MALMRIVRKRPFIVFTIVIIIEALLVLGGVWNITASMRELEAYPPAGEMVNVNNTELHVFTQGERDEERPAVLFLSGLGTPSPVADFYPLWSRLSKSEFTVVLERPGYGWSGRTDQQRSLENMLAEDRQALKQAGIAPPYIIVAHSMAGMEAQAFAARYPYEVGGVVLLDSNSPEMYLEFAQEDSNKGIAYPALRAFGLLRLFSEAASEKAEELLYAGRNGLSDVDGYYKEVDRVFAVQAYNNGNVLAEDDMKMANAETAAKTAFPDRVPVTLVVADNPVYAGQPEYEQHLKMLQEWLPAENGSLEFIEGGHYIHHYAAEEICDIILGIMD